MRSLGFSQPLFILAFDHRNTFYKHLFQLPIDQITPEQHAQITEMKGIIFAAVKKALVTIPLSEAAILVDEQYGDTVLHEAAQLGLRTAVSTEKSGNNEFEFEYKEAFAAHIEKYRPTFAKALIHYNPEDATDIKQRQQKNLKLLSDYCQSHQQKFLLELLVSATPEQLIQCNGDRTEYDRTMRPRLTVNVIQELQAAGVEPDVWKVEGLETRQDYEQVITQIKADDRNGVNLVILGRGATAEKVDQWLQIGASVPGVIGFAVGRTIFWDTLVAYHQDAMTRDQATKTISDRFVHFYQVFKASK